MQHDQKQLWLEEALTLVPEAYRPDDVRAYLNPLLKRSHSKTKHTFWGWLRIQLAKTPESAVYLYHMQESRVPPEIAPQLDNFQYTVSADGATALIPVGDDKAHGVWRVPLSSLEWAKAQTPVWLKQLPSLEPIELKRQREIKHQLRYGKMKLTRDQMSSLKNEIRDLDEQVTRLYTPVPRYQLMRTEGGHDVPVHRLFICASEDDEIDAIDGDFLNFCLVKIRMTLEPVITEGYAPANRPEPVTEEVSVPNLFVVQMNAEKQEKFDTRHLQFRQNEHGETILPYAFGVSGETLRAGTGRVGHSGGLEIHPNWDLGKRTGVEGGRVEDCGVSQPLTAGEVYAPERFGRGKPKTLDADAIRRAWRDSHRSRLQGL